MTKEERIQKYESVMAKVERPGVEDLVKFIKESSFFDDPASAANHCNYLGGLFDHSFNVTEYALSLYNYTAKKTTLSELSVESIVLCAMHHDLCKVGTYKREKRWAKDYNGKWAQYECYGVEDPFPLGHGEKSVFILQRLIKLTDEEAMAIRFHMGFVEPGAHFFYPTGVALSNAMEMSVLVRLIHIADMCAGLLEKKIDYKKEAGLI